MAAEPYEKVMDNGSLDGPDPRGPFRHEVSIRYAPLGGLIRRQFPLLKRTFSGCAFLIRRIARRIRRISDQGWNQPPVDSPRAPLKGPGLLGGGVRFPAGLWISYPSLLERGVVSGRIRNL